MPVIQHVTGSGVTPTTYTGRAVIFSPKAGSGYQSIDRNLPVKQIAITDFQTQYDGRFSDPYVV